MFCHRGKTNRCGCPAAQYSQVIFLISTYHSHCKVCNVLIYQTMHFASVTVSVSLTLSFHFGAICESPGRLLYVVMRLWIIYYKIYNLFTSVNYDVLSSCRMQKV